MKKLMTKNEIAKIIVDGEFYPGVISAKETSLVRFVFLKQEMLLPSRMCYNVYGRRKEIKSLETIPSGRGIRCDFFTGVSAIWCSRCGMESARN